ncbi:dephospho-CoA kinase [Candidatus Erwinia haradaeae]|uniref:Dephospho-CoA kinase n=1 Tax=Candidatus Erwinia haradaeae TaxID=1922217 RepID=A0A451D9A2_9GAMM|nr:dephospho-CoA kinase [Candidatus Erwinia haradaeae]VFP82824.1 Dephospho-CoA kinase [Candidatus Erwinia haradaeae]
MCYIVGLTGGIGSGKSTVANMFAQMGVDIVDADIIAREIMTAHKPVLQKLYAHFGDEIFMQNGVLNRAALRQKMFSSVDDRLWINNLLHPIIRRVSRKKLALVRSAWCLWVVPLLVENNLTCYANRILLTNVDYMDQIIRASKRDHISHEAVEKIVLSQSRLSVRTAMADDIIDNRGSLDLLRKQVAILHKRYLALARATG